MLKMPIVGSERILWRGETPTRMEFQLQSRILFHSFLGQNICKVRIIDVTLQCVNGDTTKVKSPRNDIESSLRTFIQNNLYSFVR